MTPRQLQKRYPEMFSFVSLNIYPELAKLTSSNNADKISKKAAAIACKIHHETWTSDAEIFPMQLYRRTRKKLVSVTKFSDN